MSSNRRSTPGIGILCGVLVGLGLESSFASDSGWALVEVGLVASLIIALAAAASDPRTRRTRMIDVFESVHAAMIGAIVGAALVVIVQGLHYESLLRYSALAGGLAMTMASTGRRQHAAWLSRTILVGLVTYWLLAEIVIDVSVFSESMVWMIALLPSLVCTVLTWHHRLDEATETGWVGPGLLAGSLLFLIRVKGVLPWPYTGDVTVMVISLSIALFAIAHHRMGYGSNRTREEIPRWLVLAAFGLCLFVLLQGTTDAIIRRHHEVYHYGMYNSLAANGANRLLSTCEFVPNHALSQGAGFAEPGGCWLYATYGLNLPVLALIPFHEVGWTGPHIYRWLGIGSMLLAAVPLYIIVQRISGSRIGAMASVFLLTTPFMLFWGQMFGMESFTLPLLGLGILLWMPFFGPEPENLPSFGRRSFGKLHALTFLWLLFGNIVSWFAAALLSVLLLFQNGARVRTRLLHGTFLFLACAIGFLVTNVMVMEVFFQSLGGSEYLTQKATERSRTWDYITDPTYLLRQLDWHTRLAGSGLIGLAMIGLLDRLSRDEEGGRSRGVEEASLFIFPAVCQWTVFAQAAYVHDYWVNAHLFGLALLAALGFQAIRIDRVKAIALLIVVLSTSVGLQDLHARRLDEHTFELQEFVHAEIEDDDVVLIDNVLWSIHTMKVILPDETVHISVPDNGERFLTVVSETEPDHILHTDEAWEGWGIGETLNGSGYCHQELHTGWNRAPYIAWSKC